MSGRPQRLLLDTNIWVDNYLGVRGARTQSRELIDYCLGAGVDLCVSIPSMKDIYYRIGAFLKADLRDSGEEVTESAARAIEQIAWQSVLNMTECATIVPMDFPDIVEARRFHEVHADLEDDLVLAACKRARADYLVTTDRKLLRKGAVATLDPTDMLALLKSYD